MALFVASWGRGPTVPESWKKIQQQQEVDRGKGRVLKHTAFPAFLWLSWLWGAKGRGTGSAQRASRKGDCGKSAWVCSGG